MVTLAIHYGLEIFTFDKHFERLPGISLFKVGELSRKESEYLGLFDKVVVFKSPYLGGMTVFLSLKVSCLNFSLITSLYIYCTRSFNFTEIIGLN